MQVSEVSLNTYNSSFNSYSKKSLQKANYILQRNIQRRRGLETLKESVSDKKLNIFQKAGYFLKKVKLYLDTI